MAAGSVALHTKPLQPDLVAPALDGPDPVLDASYRASARDDGYFRVPDGGITVDRVAAVVGDGRGLVYRRAKDYQRGGQKLDA